MMKRTIVSAMACMGFLVVGCAKDEPAASTANTASTTATKATASASQPAAAKPNKEAFTAAALALAKALDKEDFDSAAGMWVAKPDEMKKALPGLAKQEGITEANVNKLVAQGKFGKIADLKRGENNVERAKRKKLDPDQCYGMKTDNSPELFALWDGKGFKFFRVNNLQRLK